MFPSRSIRRIFLVFMGEYPTGMLSDMDRVHYESAVRSVRSSFEHVSLRPPHIHRIHPLFITNPQPHLRIRRIPQPFQYQPGITLGVRVSSEWERFIRIACPDRRIRHEEEEVGQVFVGVGSAEDCIAQINFDHCPTSVGTVSS
jgi:hypothetical protein